MLKAIPGARSTPPKFPAYDGWTGGTTTETMQETKSGSVVVQTVKDATWINIVSPESATPETVRSALNSKLRSSWNAEHNPSGRSPADPAEVDPGVKFRVVKDGPAKAVTIVVNVPGL